MFVVVRIDPPKMSISQSPKPVSRITYIAKGALQRGLRSGSEMWRLSGWPNVITKGPYGREAGELVRKTYDDGKRSKR